MKVAIVGSRKFRNFDMVETYVNQLPKTDTIVSGGAIGVDLSAEMAAKKRGMNTIIYKAEWNRNGRGAGFMRNSLIVNECDRLVAFWDGESNGTKHSIDMAIKRGKTVEVIQ